MKSGNDNLKRHSLESLNEGKYNNLDEDESEITVKFTETFFFFGLVSMGNF